EAMPIDDDVWRSSEKPDQEQRGEDQTARECPPYRVGRRRVPFVGQPLNESDAERRANSEAVVFRRGRQTSDEAGERGMRRESRLLPSKDREHGQYDKARHRDVGRPEMRIPDVKEGKREEQGGNQPYGLVENTSADCEDRPDRDDPHEGREGSRDIDEGRHALAPAFREGR